jgi:hypothetical protein
VRVVGKSPEEAAAHFGWFSHFTAIENRALSAWIQELPLGWQPKQAGQTSGLDRAGYFEG